MTQSPTLRYLPPIVSLNNYTSYFYQFETFSPSFDDIERADYAQLRFVLSNATGSLKFIDGHVQDLPTAHIVGPTTGNARLRADGKILVFGLGLLPAGWAAVMPIEASKGVNGVFDARDLFGPSVDMTLDALRTADSIEARHKIGCTFVERLIGHDNREARRFTALVDDWLARDLFPQVDQLVTVSGLSRRQVERNCNRYYGAPPKLLARKYRALRVALKLVRVEPALDLVAYGFCDQSHFIRELKRFTGLTPTTITDNLPMLTKLTLDRGAYEGISPIVRAA